MFDGGNLVGSMACCLPTDSIKLCTKQPLCLSSTGMQYRFRISIRLFFSLEYQVTRGLKSNAAAKVRSHIPVSLIIGILVVHNFCHFLQRVQYLFFGTDTMV